MDKQTNRKPVATTKNKKACPVACTACRYCIEHCLGCPNCACKPCKDDVALLGDAHPIKHRVVA